MCGLSGALISAALCVSAAVAAVSPAEASQVQRVRIVNVSDGDTVTALDVANRQIKVRLAHIDAPETGHGRCRPGQPFSDKSKQFLAEMVKGREVGLVCTDADRYGRSICDIQLQGTTASRELVRAGMAWANRARPEYIRDSAVPRAETQAYMARTGIWSDPKAVPPWEWRKDQWNTAPGCKK